MDWNVPLEAIRGAVARAARLPDVAAPSGRLVQRVAWRATRRAARTGSGPWIDLRRVSTTTIGRDELRYDYLPAGHDTLNPTDDSLRPVRVGNRRVRVQLYCTSLSAEPAEDAEALAERVRDRFLLPSVSGPLAAAGVGFEAFATTVAHHWVDANDREVSEAILEVLLLVAITEREDVAPAGGWIAEVHGAGTFEEGADGSDIETSLDVGPVPA